MKKALLILDADLQKPRIYDDGHISKPYVPGVDYEFMLNIHDEWQIECRPEIAEYIGKSGAWAIEQAGKHFNFRCPLSGSYSVGNNWADTH
jgi:DNA polymerase I-like protein with 3'-5' exonuclease and polymerase domains